MNDLIHISRNDLIMRPRWLLIPAFLLTMIAPGIAQERAFVFDVDSALEQLLRTADTDGDKKITIADKPRQGFRITGRSGDSLVIRRIYHLSNLLQELAQAQMGGRDSLNISVERIKEPPSERISRRIRTVFWNDLTRAIDEEGLAEILRDPKASPGNQRLYIAPSDTAGIKYYRQLEKDLSGFQVVLLPDNITPEYVQSINDQPGLLALKTENGKAVPFVVPGGRFNEMYGWDSYFISLGLLLDNRDSLARAMVDNLVYQVNHYGKILNANRSYYLTRSQPPFLSSLVRKVYEAMEQKDSLWLRTSLGAAIREYEQVWMEEGERLTPIGLNRYLGQGIGIPPETEPGHFEEILLEFAQKHKMSLEEFTEGYKTGEIRDEALDEYFRHDRTMRESGHDTTWRLVGKATELVPVGLNALLYKYETDFAYLIRRYFDGVFRSPSGRTYTDDFWRGKASTRKDLMKKYLWDPEAGGYFDYDLTTENRTSYLSATNFYPLWAGIPTAQQAQRMVRSLEEDLVAKGGILASSLASTEASAKKGIQRQWDYPYGWAPHQMLLWEGLLQYGFEPLAHELIYRWLWMITRNAVDYNGTVPEKFDVVKATHKVYAEYGNVGTEFAYITTSGFGWMNASYQLGLELLPEQYRDELDDLVPPDKLFP